MAMDYYSSLPVVSVYWQQRPHQHQRRGVESNSATMLRGLPPLSTFALKNHQLQMTKMVLLHVHTS